MKGFLRRDLYLLLPNAKIYAVALAAFAILDLFSDFTGGFIAVYVIIFAASSLLGLFSYDDANHWPAYAAAAPGGRKAQVDGRYLLSLLVGAVTALILALFCLLPGGGALAPMLPAYAGMFLLYVSIVFPLSYRFSANRGRLIVLVCVAVVAGVMASAGSIFSIEAAASSVASPARLWGNLLLLAVGAVALPLSWRLSRRVMANKEL